MTSSAKTVIYICSKCRPADYDGPDQLRPGKLFAASVDNHRSERALDGQVVVKEVQCLGVCDQPCTVAFSGEGKYGYIIGGLALDQDEGAVLDFAVQYGASEDGITVSSERPPAVRLGVVARMPAFGVPHPLIGDVEDD